jgi:hypothetical protein
VRNSCPRVNPFRDVLNLVLEKEFIHAHRYGNNNGSLSKRKQACLYFTDELCQEYGPLVKHVHIHGVLQPEGKASLAWLAHTRPDISGGTAELVKITEEEFALNPLHCRFLANRIVRFIRRKERKLKYRPLDLACARLVVYADAGGENFSQLGYVITLQDKRSVCHILYFGSRQSPRVVTGVFSGEAIALSNAFDEAFTFRYDLNRFLQQHIPISLRTDSLALFEAISRKPPPKEHRLCIDLAQLKEF